MASNKRVTKHSLTSLTSALHGSFIGSNNLDLSHENKTPTSKISTTHEHTGNGSEFDNEDFTELNEMENECEDFDEDWGHVKFVDITEINLLKGSSRTSSKRNIRFGISESEHRELRSSMWSNATTSLESLQSNVLSSVHSNSQSISEPQADFFESLGGVPNISDLPFNTLRGKFVDPLTGNDVSGELLLTVSNNEGEISENKIKNIESSLLEEESSGIILEEFSFEDFDKRYPEETIKIEEDASNEENFKMFEESSFFHGSAAKTSDYIIDNEKQLVNNIVQNFLNDLIKETIIVLSQEKSARDARKILSKTELVKDLIKTMLDFCVERKANSFLSRKVVEYCRRKGFKRYIEEDNPETDLPEMTNYQAKCEELDRLLGKEVDLTRKVDYKVYSLTEKIKYLDRKQAKAQVSFKNLVRKTLKCDGNIKLALIVDTELAQMAKLRKEISLTRSDVIQRLHTLTTLQEQIKKVENIGGGRNVADFELLYSKTGALSKKIEDRQADLDKMHERFQVNLHMMAHSQLKRESIARLTKSKKKALSNLLDEEHLCRQQLYRAQMKRKHIRSQLKELSQQCGLLDKPELLIDFDDTMEHLKKKRDEVDHLQNTYVELTKKLQQHEGNMSLTKEISNMSKNKSNPKYEKKNIFRGGFV